MNKDIIPQLKDRLKQTLPGKEAQLKMAPSFRPDEPYEGPVTKAGVLLLLYDAGKELCIVFIKRPEYDGVHSAQISFPGGKQEPGDESMIATALRETEEEIGVPSSLVEVLGSLTPLFIPVSKMEVYPAVGFASTLPEFKTDPYEVDYLIETSVRELSDPGIRMIKPYSDGTRTGNIPYFDVRNNHIWGATAMILNEFMELLTPRD